MRRFHFLLLTERASEGGNERKEVIAFVLPLMYIVQETY
jgi:hypothetical protein